jgi:hypothetical protein
LEIADYQFMLCQKCQQRQATAHILERCGDELLSDDGEPSLKLHFCETCYEEWRRESLASPTGEPRTKEQVRVIESSSECTVVRLVRTESQPAPEDWILMTPRLPEKFRVVGMEFGIWFTPSELEFLKGNQDSML